MYLACNVTLCPDPFQCFIIVRITFQLETTFEKKKEEEEEKKEKDLMFN